MTYNTYICVWKQVLLATFSFINSFIKNCVGLIKSMPTLRCDLCNKNNNRNILKEKKTSCNKDFENSVSTVLYILPIM